MEVKTFIADKNDPESKAVADMFEVLCDCSFQEYLEKCIQGISRNR